MLKPMLLSIKATLYTTLAPDMCIFFFKLVSKIIEAILIVYLSCGNFLIRPFTEFNTLMSFLL